ncbi:hypothetical protein [Microvirga vignae]|uniref:hypothetical protein n=1 Tax=Microvirga vignae TaxID=1225564 RepID=UPI0012379759|nr:hypothetical protein [Microvirga vignae]
MARKIYGSSEAREQAGVFTSQILLNLSFFIVIVFASLRLDPGTFARLSLTNSWINVLATLFAFGLDQSALKLSFERRDSSYIAINIFAKAALFMTAFLSFLIGTALFGPNVNLMIVAAAAGVAFWSATRVVEQYERRFTRLTWMNSVLAITRVGAGSIAVLFNSWILIILAVHVVAQLPIHFATLTTAMRNLWPMLKVSSVRPLLVVSPLMFTSAALYSALPVITQSLLHYRGEDLATSAFGVALIFMAPIDILIATIRNYVLPQVLYRDLNEVNVFGLGNGSFNTVVTLFAVLFIAVTLPVAGIIHWIYGQRLAMAGPFFLIYFGGLIITASIGLYNIRAQRHNLLRIALMVNLGRVGATTLPFLFPAASPLAIVTWSAVVQVVGEVILWVALTWAERNRALTLSPP